jgi:aerobic-type carbon monoxide dehydrogenase small subunit (CoxS/CutS family)
MSVSVILNGRLTVLDCAPATMLLDALRDGEGLTSVRATCGIGVCGACTVLLDGEPVTGCLTMAGRAEGRAITTLEGLGGSDPVQRAFAAEHAFQCGWCTSACWRRIPIRARPRSPRRSAAICAAAGRT